MDSVELSQALLGLKFMRELPEKLRTKAVAVLQEVSEPRRVPEGGVLIREHEHKEDKGYILVKGAMAIRKTDAPETFCEAPELLGEMMQFNPAHARTATVTATEDSVVLRFLWGDFWAGASQGLSEEEQATLKSVLENVAWEHLTA